MRKFVIGLLALGLGAGAGCSAERPREAGEQPAAEKQEPQAQALTARAAFQRMLPQARLWGADARPSRMESISTEQARGAEGTSTVWRAEFVSPARGTMRTFLWSGATGPDAPAPGITASPEAGWSPANRETQPFDPAFLRTDSDRAFEVAQGRGGEAILKKDPEHPVTYVLDWDPRKNQLYWRVFYGTDTRDAKLRIVVNASTGEYLRTEK
jgi:hypothetical protein